MKITGIILGVVLYVAALIILNGLALTTLWGWFVVPLGVSALTFVHALGLSLLATLMISGFKTAIVLEQLDNRDSTQKLISPILMPVMAMIVGYVLQYFM